jgi:hypothetical protein
MLAVLDQRRVTLADVEERQKSNGRRQFHDPLCGWRGRAAHPAGAA